MKTKAMYVIGIALLALGLAAAASAWPLNESEQPGSVIVFHKFIAGTVDNRPATQFEISATCPKGFACEEGRVVRLRAHWVCPPDANDATVCRETDFELRLTINGTIVFDPNGGGGAQPAPCPRGYLIAWVIDEFGQGIKFDSLIGDAVISTGPTSARAYNALPIQAAEHLDTGTVITGDNGPLAFDGDNYRAVTGKIYGGVRYESDAPPLQTDLTLLTLDVRSNLPNEETFVGLNFYNEGETLHSTGTNFTCWSERSLRTIDPGLDAGAMGSLKGLVESTFAVSASGTPVTLVGIVETQELVRLPFSTAPQTVVTTANVPFICLVNQTVGNCTFTGVAGCPAVRPSLGPGTTVRCTGTAPAQFGELFGIRDHAYSLFHDGTPVPTRFEPKPPPPQ
jgi:hypothetical protein